MADYPGALHAFIDPTTKTGQPLSSEHIAAHTELASELAAVQAELGVDPSGAYTTVAARLGTLGPSSGSYGLRATTAIRALSAYRCDANSYSTQNRLTFIPVLIAAGGSLLRHWYTEVGTGAAGASVRVGIYGSDAAGLPSALLREWGTLPATAAGTQILSLAGGDEQSLSPGLYWLASVIQGGAAVVTRYVSPYGFGLALHGEPPGSTGAQTFDYPYQDGVTGGLPATAAITGWAEVGIYAAVRVQ